jgi:predicted MFS family arabinose efflux permease
VLARGGDPPEPPAVLARGGDPPEPPEDTRGMTARVIAERGDPTRKIVPLLISTGISVTGDGAFLAAAPLLAAAVTTNPVAVSTVTAGFYVPWIVVGLPTGVIVDRLPRRRVMIIADLARACVLAPLVVLVLTRLVSVPVIVLAVLCIGVAQCFFDSAAQSVIPEIVGRDKDVLAHVNGRFWSLDAVGRSLLGPPLGSACFALARAVPFVADAATFLASAALVRRLPQVPVDDRPRESLKMAIGLGVRHITSTPDLGALALSTGAANFAFNASMAIFVLYAREILHVPLAAYGLLIAAGAVGGVLAGWRARALNRHLSFRQSMAISSLAQAAAWAGTAITGNVWVAASLFTVAGATTSLANVALGSARQNLTPDYLLGRVTATYRFVAVGAAGIGAIVGGVVAGHFGLGSVLMLSAGCLFVNAVLTWPLRSGRQPSRTQPG